MRTGEELFDLRAERIELLDQLQNCSNSKRQAINKKLMRVSKKIQKLAGIVITVSERDEL